MVSSLSIFRVHLNIFSPICSKNDLASLTLPIYHTPQPHYCINKGQLHLVLGDELYKSQYEKNEAIQNFRAIERDIRK